MRSSMKILRCRGRSGEASKSRRASNGRSVYGRTALGRTSRIATRTDPLVRVALVLTCALHTTAPASVRRTPGVGTSATPASPADGLGLNVEHSGPTRSSARRRSHKSRSVRWPWLICLDANVLSHHACVLMFENVAVIHEGVLRRCRPIERNKKFGLFLDQNDVLPTRQVNRRRLAVNGEDEERGAMDMEGMLHTDRENFPYLAGSEFDLLVDASEVMGFSVDAHGMTHRHFARPLVCRAHPAIQDELTTSYGFVRVGGVGRDKACRQALDMRSCRGRLEAHHGLVFAIDAMLHHRSERTELLIWTGLERDGFAVCEVDQDFKPVAGRHPKLGHRDWRG